MTARARLISLAIATAIFATHPSASRAARDVPEVTIENVRVGFGDGMAKNGYKIGAWTPVWVDLKGGPQKFEGVLEFIAPDDANTPTTIAREISVPANDLVTVSILARPGSRFGEVGIRVTDRARRRQKATWTGATIESIPPDVAVVLASGQVPGLVEMKGLPKYANPAGNGALDRLIVAPIRPRDGFPAKWYGFDAADAVVLDTNDPATLARLRESGALIDWVRQGGHLVVAVGQNWQAVLDSPLGEILPATPNGRIELNDPGLIDQYAGASTKPLVAPDAKEKLRVTKFEDWERRGGVVVKASSVTPLVVRAPYGFGRVTMIGIDVDQKPFSTWEERRLLWDKLLDLGDRGAAIDSSSNVAVIRQRQNDLSAGLYGSLQRFPGVRLVPFGWVAFFVFLYILLIGPGDYFFLRKVVKRMELTWVTFPLIVLTVSGVAYAAAYYFKGTDLRINKVDAVDIDQTTGQARGWSWLTLFSPQNRDYDVGFAPLPPDAVPPAGPLADPASPRTANVEVLTSWFGEPDGGGGGSGGLGFGGGYEYGPMSEPEALSRVRVNIWSTKSFQGRWSAPVAAPILESDLVPDGPDRLRGTVTNVTRRPLKNAALFFSRYVYVLNEIAPGATVTLGEAQVLAGYMDGLNFASSFNEGSPSSNGEPPGPEQDLAAGRPDLVRALMFHAGLGPKAASMPSFALRTMDLTDHLALRRPMLVADVDGPAALLKLGGAGRDPKMVQTTVLRVILPLKSGAVATPAAR